MDEEKRPVLHVDDDGYEKSSPRLSSGEGRNSAIRTVGDDRKHVDGQKALKKGKMAFGLLAVWSALDSVRARRLGKETRKVARQIKELGEKMQTSTGGQSDGYGSMFADAFCKSFQKQQMKDLERRQEKLQTRKERRDMLMHKMQGLGIFAGGISQASRMESMKSMGERMVGRQDGIRGEEMAGMTARQAATDYEPEM